jgi:hypothetical protein
LEVDTGGPIGCGQRCGGVVDVVVNEDGEGVELEIAGRKREAWHLYQSTMKFRKANLAVLRAD